MGRARDIEATLRELTPQVLGALVRHYGHFDACEDAVQDALLDATVAWTERGIPHSPRGWLITVASRRLTDQWRSDSARRRRETTAAAMEPAADLAPPPDGTDAAAADDSLALLFLCCHPALSPPSQVALTLRAVGGLSTAQIARAFLVPEATMAQRISRAKQQITAAGARFRMSEPERAQRLGAVLHVLYLVFNEGYVASSGPDPLRVELTDEAIRLVREVRRQLPDEGEVAGLLALMLLTDARRPARTRSDGGLVPLAEQDRSRWNRALITEGVALITETLAHARVGPFQIQAAIAAVHAEATDAPRTPTGHRSSRSTTCSPAPPRIPWCCSTGPSPPPWCTGPAPGWTCSPTWTATATCPVTTDCTPSAPIFWNRRATTWRRRPHSPRPPAGRPASPSSATCRPRPPGSPPTTPTDSGPGKRTRHEASQSRSGSSLARRSAVL